MQNSYYILVPDKYMVVRQYACAAKNHTRMRRLFIVQKRKTRTCLERFEDSAKPLHILVSGKQWCESMSRVLITVATPKRSDTIVRSFVYRQCTGDSKRLVTSGIVARIRF